MSNISIRARNENACFATDEIGIVHYPKIKIVHGINGAATDVSADNPMPVSVVGGSASGLTDAQLRASPVPVSGTMALSGTIPVSGPLTDTQLRASSVTVSGTFWQATQPISAASLPLPAGAGTSAKQDTIIGYIDGIETLLAGNLNVVGAFYPATQPVSGTVSVSGSVAVTGTFWQATQLVSLSALPALVAGSALVGKVGVDQTTPGTTNGVSCAFIGATAVATGNGTASAGCQRVTVASDNTAIPVVAPTLTKATQAATGFSTQDLKDSGRVIVNAATAIAGVTAVTTEAMLALNVSRDGAATASVTTITVTSGKRFRVVAIIASVRSSAATVLSGRVSLRMNPSGAAIATSPVLAILSMTQQAAALAEAGDTCVLPIPDGIEFSGTMQFGLSQVCSGTGGVVYASIIGFEY